MPVIAHSVAHWPRLVRPQCRSSSHEHGVSCAPIGAWRRRWPTHTFANELRAVSGDTAAADAQQPSIAEPEESNQPKISQQQAEPKIALKDVEVGKTYKSKVRKIMPYGAFVDIGAESDALVHISELSKRFVEKVGDVLDVGETLDVKVIKLDVESGRISCSIKALLPNASTPVEKKDGGRRTQQQRRRPRMNGQAKGGRDRPIKAPPMKIGEEVKGKVDTILAWGAFISLENGERALLHVTEIRQAFTEFEESKPNANDFLEEGQELTLRVRSIDRKGQVAVTERTAEEIKRVNELSQSGLQYTPEDAPPQMMEGLFGNAGITRNMFPDMPERAAFDEEYEEAQADIGSKGGVPLREAEQPPPAVAQAEKTILKQTTGDSVAEAVEEVQDKSEPAPVEEVKVDSVPAPPPPVQEEPVPALAVETSPTPESQMSNGANSEGTKTEDAAPVKISAQLVKELRVMTGAGMMDCKKALKECDGELEEAVEYLRKKGIATAAKKAGRIASEGLIHSHVHEGGKTGILLEVNCETDFVARGDQFRELVDDIAKQIAECPDVVCITTDEVPADLLASGNPKEAFALLEQPFFRNTEKTVGQLLTETTAALGEKIAVRRFERYTLSDPLVGPTTEEGKDLMGGIGCYVHAGRQGVMVEISCETDDVAQGDAFKELLMDAALQITASPDVQYVSRDDVPSGVVEKEKEIEMGKEDLLSKPEQMRAKISEGRVEKTLNTQCLLNQPFVKDQNKTVADVLKDVSEATGEGVVVRRFTRFLVGEGLEKRSNDFAAEVAAQMQSA